MCILPSTTTLQRLPLRKLHRQHPSPPHYPVLPYLHQQHPLLPLPPKPPSHHPRKSLPPCQPRSFPHEIPHQSPCSRANRSHHPKTYVHLPVPRRGPRDKSDGQDCGEEYVSREGE